MEVAAASVPRKKMTKQLTGKRDDNQLHSACRAGNVGLMRELFSECNEEQLTELLLKQNSSGETPLYVAVEYGYVELVKELIDYYDLATAGIKARNGFDALHIAAKQGDLDMVKVLMETHPELSMTVDMANTTTLHTAATQGHMEVVFYLLELERSLATIARSNGKTALHSAARNGHAEVVKALLSKEPGLVTRTDKKRQTALQMAVKGQNIVVVEELIMADPSSINMTDNKGNTALHTATRKGRAQAEEMAQTFRQRIAQAEAMARADMLRFQPELADVWSCGVTLYFMLVGEYPFTDQKDSQNWSEIMQRILNVQYKIPESVDISQDCRHLLSRIFVAPASRRITIEEIKNHPWFLKNLPWKESEAAQSIYYRKENSIFSTQSVESIMEIVGEDRQPAINPAPVSSSIEGFKREKEENDGDEEQNLKDCEDRQANEKSEQKLVRPELYMTHTRKRSRYSLNGTPGFTNPASMEIAVRYANILDQNRNYFTQVGYYEDMTNLMEWWIHATVPEDHRPKKNRRIGLSLVPATQLLTDLAARYHSERSDSSSSTATGRVNPSTIPDIVFLQVVRQILQNAQTNLPTYTRLPSYEQVTALARTALEIADPNSHSTSTFSGDIVGEVIEVVGNILADIYEKYEARTQELQESAGANEDSEDDTTVMDEDTNDSGNAARMSPRSIYNGSGCEDRWIHDFGDEF